MKIRKRVTIRLQNPRSNNDEREGVLTGVEGGIRTPTTLDTAPANSPLFMIFVKKNSLPVTKLTLA
jgi:hypothetical protein